MELKEEEGKKEGLRRLKKEAAAGKRKRWRKRLRFLSALQGFRSFMSNILV
ncbi:MAG: hypothetical protein LBD02_04200 [Christensenellaceae bacterium]|nr:hypothetical protein [Christensenellaceae bacterium]